MRHLAELVAYVGPDHCLCSCNEEVSESTQQLYDYLRESEDPNTTEAAAFIDLEERSTAFRRVRAQLKVELVNTLTAVRSDTGEEGESRQQAYAYVWKLIAIGKQLRNSVTSGVLLAYLREAFERAVALDMYDAAFQAATMLRRQYNNRRFDPELYRYYRDEAAHYRLLSQSYQDVVADLNEIAYLRNIKADPALIKEFAATVYERNAHLIELYDVAPISYIVYLTQLNAYLADYDYAAVIEVANAALAYLTDKADAQPAMYQVFEANLSVAYTQLNDYENGMKFARRMLETTSRTEYNYIKVYELMLVLTLRAGKFQEAYLVYRDIGAETLTTDLRSYFHETFRIIEAYLYLLVKMKQIVVSPDDGTFARFRIKRFVNSFEHAVNEKSHRNIHLLVIQIVDDIIHHRHTQSIYSIEAITKYAQRYLRGRGYERVRYFLKALAQLSTQSFHRAAVERHTRRYIDGLEKHPLRESRHDLYLELIPYDLLWNLILEHLGYRRLRSRRRGAGSRREGD